MISLRTNPGDTEGSLKVVCELPAFDNFMAPDFCKYVMFVWYRGSGSWQVKVVLTD